MGIFGDDKERKHWNSGRLLYNTILKYMFEGMGLTPGARLVIQHITPWDPELAAACMEQHALKANDMPTVTYVATGWTPTHATICQEKHRKYDVRHLEQYQRDGHVLHPRFRTECT